MKDLGKVRRILGMEIERDRVKGRVSLNQKGYLQKLLQKFNICDDAKTVSVPLAPHFKLSAKMSPKTVEDREYMKNVPYARAVCSLMYVMVCMRPNLSQAVSMVSRHACSGQGALDSCEVDSAVCEGYCRCWTSI